jgi:uncharacterized protein YjiS (DUF1127 family)
MFADTTLRPVASGIRLRERLGAFLAAVQARAQARHDLRRLSEMPDRMLDDIGLTRDDIRRIRRSPYRYL